METKAEHPSDYLKQGPFDDANPLIAAYFEINQLKLLYRQGWLHRGVSQDRCESVADHCFGVVFLAMWLADNWFPDLDPLKVLRLAVLHDLGEVYCGDLTPSHGVHPHEKARREREAVEQVLGKLSGGERYVALWDEYEEQKSPESRLVRCTDRLEMALQACVYEYGTGLDLGEFLESARKVMDGDELNALMSQLDGIRPSP